MGQSGDRPGVATAVEEVFGHPAFAALKAEGAAFALVRPATREVLWANATAAAFWKAPQDALGARLFGPPGGGWLGPALAAAVPGRMPQMFRTGLPQGLGMRGRLILVRAVTGTDAIPVVGIAVPGSGGARAAPGAWQDGTAPADAPAADPAAVAQPASPEARPGETGDAETVDSGLDPGAEEASSSLAARSQSAVLRDRLAAALDGAATHRFLWRTDAGGALVRIDEVLRTRLGTPLAAGPEDFPALVSRFDPEAGARLGEALASRATWSGLALRLPVAGGAAVVRTLLSGSPVFGRARVVEGFRGFGTLDLADLEPAPRAEPAAVAPDAGDGVPAATVGPETPPPPAPPPDHPSPGDPRPGDVPASDHPPVVAPVDERQPNAPSPIDPLPIDPPASDEPSPAMPRQERPAFHNVVDLRSFQALRPAAAGEPEAAPTAAQPSAPEPPAADPPVAAPTLPDVDDGTPASRSAPDDGEGPASDAMAFLALGEALRAQIGADAQRDAAEGRTGAPAAHERSGPSADPAAAAVAALLDRMVAPMIVIGEAGPLHANPAAAQRLGFSDPAALLAAGPVPAVSATRPALLLSRGGGDPLAVAAEPLAVEWDGRPATLWTVASEPPPAERGAEPVAPPRPENDDRPVDLIDRVDDAVALLDGEGRVRRLNERGRDWFGPAALGDSITGLLMPESRSCGLRLIEEARARGEGSAAPPPRRDVAARLADGTALTMLLTIGRLGAAGFYATLRDVSALKRAEHQEARSRGERERDADRLPDLLARVSHEIRTPLNAILGFAEVMMDERFGPLGSPRYRDYLKDIHASGTQVVALVGDLLDLSRIEAGRIDLAVEPVDVNKIVAEIVAQMQPEANRERVIVRTSLASRIPPVLADERSARQIVHHLLSNAVKFNEPGGQVIVSTAQDDAGAVLLRIRDTGVGMTEAEIAAALEPFHDVSPPRPANGNGLGLPLARALVGANGASLAIRSRPREGTLVEVSFPSAPAEGARRPA